MVDGGWRAHHDSPWRSWGFPLFILLFHSFWGGGVARTNPVHRTLNAHNMPWQQSKRPCLGQPPAYARPDSVSLFPYYFLSGGSDIENYVVHFTLFYYSRPPILLDRTMIGPLPQHAWSTPPGAGGLLKDVCFIPE